MILDNFDTRLPKWSLFLVLGRERDDHMSHHCVFQPRLFQFRDRIRDRCPVSVIDEYVGMKTRSDKERKTKWMEKTDDGHVTA